METKEERIAKLELRIEIFENELRKLKNEVAAIKGLEEVEKAVKNPIYGMRVEEMNLSIRSYNCLKRAGYDTLGEILALSEKDFLQIRNLGRKPYEEILAKIKELASDYSDIKIMADIKKREEADTFNFELSQKILPAFEVYIRIRKKAKQEGIGFYHMSSGVFSGLLRKNRAYDGYVYRMLNVGKGILPDKYHKECMSGMHPKMYKLLTTSEKEPSMQQIKAAIIEDFTENNVLYNHETRTYEGFIKFIELINEFEE